MTTSNYTLTDFAHSSPATADGIFVETGRYTHARHRWKRKTLSIILFVSINSFPINCLSCVIEPLLKRSWNFSALINRACLMTDAKANAYAFNKSQFASFICARSAPRWRKDWRRRKGCEPVAGEGGIRLKSCGEQEVADRAACKIAL